MIKLHKNAENLQGQTFGRLTVLYAAERLKEPGRTRIIWSCRCSCGEVRLVPSDRLKTGHTQSCGCWRQEQTRLTCTTHGKTRSPEYQIYHAAKRRCTNPKNSSYKDYGGRGILFLFSSFEQFYNDVGPRPSSSHTLDRIKNNKNYEVGNVRWATMKEQNLNKRNKRLEQFSDAEIGAEFKRRCLAL